MDADILQNTSFLYSLGVALLLGLLSPLVGMFLVVRRFSLLADTLAHVSLLGVAIGLLFHIPITAGAMIVAVIGGWGIEMLRQSRRILSDATLAVFLSGSLAIALLLFALQNVNGDEIEGYLFGNLASVTGLDLSLLVMVAIVLLTFFFLNYQKLFVVALDEDLARVNGVHVNRLNTLFMLIASLVVAIAIKIVGVLLVSALIVLPVLAAMQWRFGFQKTLFLSILFSEMAVMTGFFVAFGWQLPSGATIALFSLSLFVFSYLFNWPKRVF
ncbi:MAG: metal ABC transporter permease [Candidatus Moraniibacteriota bacterium]